MTSEIEQDAIPIRTRECACPDYVIRCTHFGDEGLVLHSIFPGFSRPLPLIICYNNAPFIWDPNPRLGHVDEDRHYTMSLPTSVEEGLYIFELLEQAMLNGTLNLAGTMRAKEHDD